MIMSLKRKSKSFSHNCILIINLALSVLWWIVDSSENSRLKYDYNINILNITKVNFSVNPAKN